MDKATLRAAVEEGNQIEGATMVVASHTETWIHLGKSQSPSLQADGLGLVSGPVLLIFFDPASNAGNATAAGLVTGIDAHSIVITP
jgi:hypothetical protein